MRTKQHKVFRVTDRNKHLKVGDVLSVNKSSYAVMHTSSKYITTLKI